MRYSGSYQPLVPRPVDRLDRRELRKRIYDGTVASAGARVSQIEYFCLQHRPSVLRTMVRPDRLPHFQIHLPASNSWSAVGDQWFGLGDLSAPATRKLSVALHRCRLRSRGNTAGAMAHRDGFERSEMVRASEHAASGCGVDSPPRMLFRAHFSSVKG